jgi:hypothetical protein
MEFHQLALLSLLLAGCGGQAASTDGGASDGGDAGKTLDATTIVDATPDSRILDEAEAPCARSCPDGCCLPDNTCLTSPTADACGGGGELCVSCATGETCQAGACVRSQPGCGPSNCAGCCLDASTCATTGRSDFACGSGGGSCEQCVPSQDSGACAPDPDGGGICGGTGSCNFRNCGTCCVGGDCSTYGLSQTQCGTNGENCQACTGGERCESTGGAGGGQCVLPPDGGCGPLTCNGCCDGDVCAVGTQQVACGTGGVTCLDCALYGRTCQAGACQ